MYDCYKLYVYFNLYVYISRHFNLPISMEMYMSGHVFSGHPYIEITVLSDKFVFVIILLHKCRNDLLLNNMSIPSIVLPTYC